jgi:hypothetical protein
MSQRLIPMSANSRSLKQDSFCTTRPYRAQCRMKPKSGDNMNSVLLQQYAGITQKMWVSIDALQWNSLRCSQARDAYPNG